MAKRRNFRKDYIKSYADADATCSRRGKPSPEKTLDSIGSTLVRPTQPDGAFVVRCRDGSAEIYPDDTVVLRYERGTDPVKGYIGTDYNRFAHDFVGIGAIRAKAEVYKALHAARPKLWVKAGWHPAGGYFSPDWRGARSAGPILYSGIRFNMLTGECLNPIKQVKETNREAQAEWNAKVAEYQKQWVVRAKLGVIRDVLGRVEGGPRRSIGKGNADLLEEIIENLRFDDVSVHAILGGAGVRTWREHTRTDERLQTAFKRCYTYVSEVLRKKRGIIHDATVEA